MTDRSLVALQLAASVMQVYSLLGLLDLDAHPLFWAVQMLCYLWSFWVVPWWALWGVHLTLGLQVVLMVVRQD